MMRTMPSTDPPGGSPCTMVIGRLGQFPAPLPDWAAAGMAPKADSPASTVRRVSATMMAFPTFSQTWLFVVGARLAIKPNSRPQTI